jgi:hypothetical protein
MSILKSTWSHVHIDNNGRRGNLRILNTNVCWQGEAVIPDSKPHVHSLASQSYSVLAGRQSRIFAAQDRRKHSHSEGKLFCTWKRVVQRSEYSMRVAVEINVLWGITPWSTLVEYLAKLSPTISYSVKKEGDIWMINWQGSGRKLCHSDILLETLRKIP